MHATPIFFPSLPIKLFTEKMRVVSPGRRPPKYITAGEFGRRCTCTNAATEKTLQKSNNSLCSSNFDFGFGSLEQNGIIFRQKIFIRSFEIGFDRKLTLAALANYLQDTALNHGRMIGLLADGLGSTPEMSKRELIWVVCNLHILVDRYPSWHDVVEVDTWMYPSGQIGLGRDWVVRDAKTGQPLAQATSKSVVFNKKTRKLCKLTKEIKDEIAPHMAYCDLLIKMNAIKILPFDFNTADCARTGLTAGWNDLDLNQHVNHVQYINWVLENVPHSLIESHKLSAISLEYRQECNMNSVLKSLYKIVKNVSTCNSVVELDHFLLLENGTEIARAKTIWKLREVKSFIDGVQVPAEDKLCL